MNWEHQGFIVQEGKRPGAPVKGRIQYFFLVLKDDVKVFKYCVWIDRSLATQLFDEIGSGKEEEVLKYLKEKGINRVREKIESRDFQNICLLIDDRGAREVFLDELEEKLE